MVAPYFAPTMSDVNLQYAQANQANTQANVGIPAQAALAQSEVAKNAAATTGLNIGNENSQIDLASKKGMIAAQRQKFQQVSEQPAPPTTTTTPASPVANNTTGEIAATPDTPDTSTAAVPSQAGRHSITVTTAIIRCDYTTSCKSESVVGWCQCGI